MLITKTIVTELNNVFDELINRKERISKLEEMSIESSKIEIQKDKTGLKKQNIQNLWKILSCMTNVQWKYHKEKKEKGTEEKLKAIVTEFSKLMVDIKSQMQEVWITLNRINTKKLIPVHIIFKLQDIKHKGKIYVER